MLYLRNKIYIILIKHEEYLLHFWNSEPKLAFQSQNLLRKVYHDNWESGTTT